MILVTGIILGYLIGSIPFALIIGKLFYKTDIREHGSGNLGGGNTGRVLGKKAGLSVMTCDILKVSFVILIVRLMGGGDLAIACAAAAAAIGHCFPVFAGFRGGKAVAAMYGFFFGLFAFAGRSVLIFLIPLAVFMIVLYFFRIIALSSMVSAAAGALLLCLMHDSMPIRAAAFFFVFLIVVRHRSNLKRMLEHRENKITWMS